MGVDAKEVELVSDDVCPECDNIHLFRVFLNIEEHFQWEAEYDSRFPGSIGSMKKMFLSPQMTVSIDQQKVSLGIIRRRKELLHGRELIETVK